MIRFVLLIVLLLICCGEKTTGPETSEKGKCYVGMVLIPGESCSLGDERHFFVNDVGYGCIEDVICDEERIGLNIGNLLQAQRDSLDNWTIMRLGRSD